MKQVHARSDRVGQRQMACSIGVRYALERHQPIVRRRTTKLSAKCAGKHFVAGEARVNRDFQDRLVAGNKPGGGAMGMSILMAVLGVGALTLEFDRVIAP